MADDDMPISSIQYRNEDFEEHAAAKKQKLALDLRSPAKKNQINYTN